MVIPNIFTAIFAFGRWVRALFKREPTLVSDSVLADRLETCGKCDFLDPETRQCRKCTCFVDIKANLTTETCPESLWKE